MRNEFTELSIRETLRLEYRPIDPLRLDFDFTLSKTKGTTDVFRSSHHTDFATAGLPENKGSYTKGNSDDNSYRVSLTASYNKVFGGAHLVSLLGRYTVQQSDAYSQLLSMTGFPNDKLSEVFMGAKFGSVTGDESVSRSLGAVFTGSYSYRQRYAVDFSMRADAASQFGRDNRFAPFWSAGAKWSVHNEDFMQNAGAVDELIFRASVGTTGSQDFNPWQALQTYTYEGMMTNYISSDVVGAVLYALGNPALKWQQTLEKNIGFDVTLFEGLFGAKVELYDRRTRNTLLDYTLPPSMGFTTVKENLGEISNRGYEITARFMPWRNNAQRAYWNVVLTGGHNRSRIEKISDAMKALNQAAYTADGADLTRPLPQYVEGVSQSAIWGMRSVGIDPQTGEEIFLTRGGEFTTEWSPNDVVVIGDRRPDLAGSVTSTVAWRDLSLTVGGSYTFGGQIYNQTLADKVENADLHRNVDRRVLTDRWHAPGDVVGFKNLDGSDTRDKTKATSRFVMRNDEFRLSSVNLSYRMSAQDYGFLKHAGLGSATVGLYLEDVMRLSTVRMERGINYPFARTVSMSLNLAF
jgi:hypothetical protein